MVFRFRAWLAAILFPMVCSQLPVFAQGIQFFEGTFEQAVLKAKKENKGIFLDGYAVWCIPCKEMAQNVFTDKNVADYINAHFVSLQMDMEKPEAKVLKDRFGVMAYPTLLMLNSSGYKLEQHIGGLDAPAFLIWAAKAKGRFDEYTPGQRFDQEPENARAAVTYFQELLSNGQRKYSRFLFHELLIKSGFQALLDSDYWHLLTIAGRHDPEVKYVLGKREQFYKKFGKQVVERQLATIFTNVSSLDSLMMPRPMRQMDKSAYHTYLEDIKANKLEMYQEITAVIDFYVACKNYDYKAAQAQIDQYKNGISDWQRFRFASIANSLVYDSKMRYKFAETLAHPIETAGSSIYLKESQRSVSLLKLPFADNPLHDYTEILPLVF